ncbi:MAG: DHH family phosphoesterase [Lachnospiraceae bacterium]|nr:DHH family phosphoesterase [Lachnospiraceae bacterium]
MAGKVKLNGKLRAYVQAPLLLGVILLLINIWIYLISIRAGAVLSIFLLIYLITMVCMIIFARPALNTELVTFATEYGQIQKQLLKELELPHVLLDESGRIVWMNRAFEKLGEKEKFYKKNIHSFMPEMKRELFPEEGETRELELVYDDKEYLARIKRIALKEMATLSELKDAEEYDGFLYAVYLFDRTALNLALKELDRQSVTVGFLYIDNYEEAMDSVEDVGRSLLGAFIDRQVNQYVNDLDGIVIKTEKDKYRIILRKSSLEQAMEGKFKLLEDVKGINIGNEISVTLSIGIGLGGLSYAQNIEFARNAMDLALGRGGDQAVVKNKDEISYFGGKSQQKETTTRVRARVKAQAMEEIISARDKVFVMGHRNGDMDSFGATVGIRAAALSLQKPCQIVLDNVTPSLKPLVDLYRAIPDLEETAIISPQQAMELIDANSVVVVVDVNRPSITECPELLKRCRTIIVLDHHRQGTEVIENATLSYVEPNASSACEMTAEILQYINNGVRFKGAVADCLYAGIVMDTQNFTSKTGVRTFEAAAFLRRSGADVTRVRKMFREDAADYKAKADAVRGAEVYRKEYVIGICSGEGLKSPTVVAAQAANDLLNINGVKASFVLTEYQGQIYISARSIDEVNVQIIMEKFGGGGHMSSSGAQLKSTTMDAAVLMLKNTLDTMIQEGEIG